MFVQKGCDFVFHASFFAFRDENGVCDFFHNIMKSIRNAREVVKVKQKEEKTYSFLHQVLVIASVLFVSSIIESFMPIPMPASVIGLVLLFILLCTGVIKLGQVEKVGTALTNNIGFLFVPAGISVVNSLDIISASPILIIGLIIISTILLLVFTGFASQILMRMTTKDKVATTNRTKAKVKGAHSHG